MTARVVLRSRALRLTVGAYVAAVALALLLRPGLRAFLAPLAGPWAARVYGHT